MPPLVVKPVQMPDKLFPPAPQLVRSAAAVIDCSRSSITYYLPYAWINPR